MTPSHNTVVLGSTGAIGALQIEHYSQDPHVQVIALAAAGNHLDLLAHQAVELGVFGLALSDADPQAVHAALDEANERAGRNIRPEVLIGPDVAVQAASAGVDTVVNTIRGIAGLSPSVAALETGAAVAVANSETLLGRDFLRRYLPEGQRFIDRFTLLNPSLGGIQDALRAEEVTKVVLTTRTASRLGRRATTEHRINTQSGFAVALSLLELSAISDVPIEVFEHDGPIASVVELADGRSILNPRPHLPTTWRGSTQWSFQESRLPAISLARAVHEEGGAYPLALHTANDEAVRAHLEGRIEFDDIHTVVTSVLDRFSPPEGLAVEAALEATSVARGLASSLIGSLR